ncbi:ABC transporter ATP-binding protein [Amycolatopsis ultiminotia]|uniref:ABC transporter ATP-binding protein n=2 Tax=Amycolatopsis ultiminotia TaxID=543629 RepID=A0ABP6XDR3_9PSEU
MSEETAAAGAVATDTGERATATRNEQRDQAGRFMTGGMPPEKPMDFKGSLVRLLRLLRPQRAALLGVLVLGTASVALTVIGPKVLAQATDLIFAGVLGRGLPAGATKESVVAGLRARGDGTMADLLTRVDLVPGHGIDFTAVGRVLMLVLALYVIASFFGLIQARLTTSLVQNAVYRLRRDIEEKFARLPLRYFDSQPRGEVLSRVTNDIDNLAQSLQQTLSQIVSSVLTVLGVLVMMFVISPLLAIIALLTVPASVFVAARIGKRAQPQFIRQWSTTGRLNAHIEEMYTGHSLVKIFGRRAESEQVFREQNDELYSAGFRAQFISGTIQPAMMFIGNLNYVLVAVIGVLRVASGSLSLGDVQAFIQYSRQFSQPVTQIASMANLLQSGIASAERVFALLDAKEQEPEPARPARPALVRGRVGFEHVSFRYRQDTPLIEDLSLTVEPGQTVAIVGPTGAGKTTLVNLLMRFYEINGGRITLDGVDIAAMDREELRDKTGMVLQDAWLFGGTIADNIAYGADDVTREQVIEAATATYVDRFVRTLPDGYDTILDDEGDTVSAGEKQLITVARAFLAAPVILILDEATSSVDTRTEVLIQRAMNSLRTGRTSFVIAHRLSTIRDADVILVMENGSIVEQGDHETLLHSGGAYSRLYAAQFAEAMAETD